MVFCLIAVALFRLPQPVILPSPHVVRVGLQRPLVPDLRDLVVAELAGGVADQVCDIGVVVVAKRLQLLDSTGIIVALIDRRESCAISLAESRIFKIGALILVLVLGLAVGWRRRGRISARGTDRRD